MKKYKVFMITVFILSFFIVGCSQKRDVPVEQEKEMYEIKSEIFSEKEIVINYPQLENILDEESQSKINNLIQENALSLYNEFLKKEEDITYEVNYDVMYSSLDLLSIRYEGYTYSKGAAHPNSFINTINIDIKNQNIIKLSNIVNINEGFVNLFKNGKYKSQYSEVDGILKEAIEGQLSSMTVQEWIEYLKNGDSADIYYSNCYSYLTENALVIVISVPHVMGDYAEFEINYGDLNDYKIGDTGIWELF